MTELRKYINDGNLEKKLEAILIYGKGQVNDVCETWEGLVVIHRGSTCNRSNAELRDLLPVLKLDLFDAAEDFRKRRADDIGIRKVMKDLTESIETNNVRMNERMKELVGAVVEQSRDSRSNAEDTRETVLTKPKNPPVWGN